jgi:hypothetical protein
VTAWSYSSIKTFDQCPKKYYHLKVAKDVKDIPGEAAIYGTAVHEAAEHFIKDGTPIPEKFAFIRPTVERLAAIDGEKHCELRLGVSKTDTGYEPTTFFGKDVWWRGIVDLVVIDGAKAYMVDYKTGKNARYADPKQLDLMAGALFVHYPDLEVIKSALVYVVSNELIPKTHTRGKMGMYLSVFADELDRLEGAELSGVWNPKSGPLCGWCPVVECEHHRPRRR